MKYFVANWKVHKNLKEAFEWTILFSKLLEGNKKVRNNLQNGTIQIVICPPFTLMSVVKTTLPTLPNIEIGAQDVSIYGEGSYTGELTAGSFVGLARYVIIGHSQRRSYLGETDVAVKQKVTRSHEAGLLPIVCVRGKQDEIPEDVLYVAYEPIEAIGTGANEDVKQVLATKETLYMPEKAHFFYGGSVNRDNIDQYLAADEIEGFLVGTASLDPQHFFDLIAKV